MKRLIHDNDRLFLCQYREKGVCLMEYRPEQKKKITIGIIVDTVLHIPPLTGVTHRLYYLSRALQERGVMVKIFLCNRDNIRAHMPGVLADNSDIEYHLIPEGIFYDPEKLKHIILKHALDILQFEDAVSVLRYKQIIEALDVPVCLELHDIEATLLDGLGFTGEDISIAKAVTTLACAFADITVCMTAKDRTELIDDIGVDTGRLFLVPNPIDTECFIYHGADHGARNLLFIGNMYYWPNAQAASILVHDIFPKVRAQCPGARLTLVGLVPPKLKKQYASPGVICTGAVADLNPYLQKATLGLCPVQAGSGMKVKMLNYCASGIPALATSLGASGYEDVRGIIVEDDLTKYPEIIVKMFRDKKKIEKLGRLARQSVVEHFGMAKVVKEMLRVYQIAIELRDPQALPEKKEHSLPAPLWLREGRTPKGKDAYYYVVSHGSVRNKKNTFRS